jgi:hypothetical protein
MEGNALRIRTVVAVVACCAVIGSELLPWMIAGVGSGAVHYRGLQLTPLAVCESIAAAATIALALAAVVLHRPPLTRAAMVGAIVALILCVSVILALEIVAAAIPDSLLPATIRRNGLDLSAGIGLWAASAAAAVAALALSGWSVRSIEPRAWVSPGNRNRALALLALLSLTVLFGWLRYQAWFGASAGGAHLDLAGWASPWVGPLSLLAVWLLIGASAMALLTRTEPAGLLAAGAGWLVTFVAAVSIIAARSIGDLSDLADGVVGQGASDFQVTLVAWSAFLVGLSAAAVGAWLVCLNPGAAADR